MRLKIECSSGHRIVPFNYQYELAKCIHKWFGADNSQHGNMSLFCFSGLQGGTRKNDGLQFQHSTSWSFSSIENSLLAQLVEGIQRQPVLFAGLEVRNVMIQEEPEFRSQMRFLATTPVILKKNEDNGRMKFLLFSDEEATEALISNLCHKLDVYGKPEWKEGLEVRFDTNYDGAKTKLIDIKGIKNKGSLCPVIISGQPEAVRFAWHVGVGSNNGMGFGFLN